MALARCILGKFLGVVFHCFPLSLDVPTFAARCLHVPINASAPSSDRWNCGREWSGNFDEMAPFRDLLHAANLRHGAKGFTSLPMEGMLRIFFARRLRPGTNPRSWVPEASILTTRPPKPLKHLINQTILRPQFSLILYKNTGYNLTTNITPLVHKRTS
jgi:hypothetical protein